MSTMQEPEDRPIDVRVQSLEQRVDLLEGLGKEGLPVVRLTAIELRLEHLDEGQQFLRGELTALRSEFRQDLKEARNFLTAALVLVTGIISVIQFITN